MKVRVNNEKCQGHARCWSLAPEVFSLDDSGYILPGDITVKPGLEALAARGARACPEKALQVIDED